MPPRATESPLGNLSVRQEHLLEAMHLHDRERLAQTTIPGTEIIMRSSVQMDAGSVHGLVDRFRQDPKNTLAYGRQALFEVYDDDKLSEPEKKRKLSRYLDEYFDLIVALDHAAFPDTGDKVTRSVPAYIPDGFIDMGKDPETDLRRRSDRSQNFVDKRAILDRHKPLFEKLFSMDTTGVSVQQEKKTIADYVARYVYVAMPYGWPKEKERGGILPLSKLEKGVCQHQALLGQVLLQTFAIETRLNKNYASWNSELEKYGDNVAGGSHVSQFVRVDDQWYFMDMTNPQPDGKGGWHPGIFKINYTPNFNERETWIFDQKDGQRRKYQTRHDMYWRIDKNAAKLHR